MAVTSPDVRPGPRNRGDLVAGAVGLALVAVAVVVGWVLNRHHVPLYVEAPPLYASWRPHLGPGTPVAVALAAAGVVWGPGLAARLPWRRLLASAYLAAAGWTLALALVDGWRRGLAGRLTVQGEYLTEVSRVVDIPATLRDFTAHIVDAPGTWSTHTAGHPPGALLLFVWLDRIGLHGGGWAALACVLLGATVAVTVPLTLKALRDEQAARACVPFLVLFPGAVWMGVSADAIFTAVVAAGVALLAVRWAALAGGVLLGLCLYLSYGLVLVAALAVVVVLLARHPVRLLPAALGAATVVAVFTAAGFWWLDGYHLVVVRYYQGWAAQRPYAYWVWANLACLVLSAGPATAPILRRCVRSWRRPAAALALAATAAILAADLSGLSKAEVERIWLPYAVWLPAGAVLLPTGSRRWWLAAQAATALAVNHLLLTHW